MRILMYYLLIPCLFLLKGWQPGLTGPYQCLPGKAAYSITKSKAALSNLPQGNEELSPSVLNDGEDDDDEFSPLKKKNTNNHISTGFENRVLPGSLLVDCNNSNRFYKHFSYLSSRKFILYREIII